MSRLFKSAAAIAVAAVLGLAGTSRATISLPAVLNEGDVVGGWKITFDPGISLDADSINGGVNLVLEKFANFTKVTGLDITFTQVSYNATPIITFSDEHVHNNTGTPWGGFDFLLNSESPGNTPAAFKSGFAFNDDTPPFPNQTDGPNKIALSGGILGDTDTAGWGGNATLEGGSLVIDANPSTMCMKQVIDFKELPIAAAVPLPSAAWTGLTGLIGLGFIGGVKKVKKVLA